MGEEEKKQEEPMEENKKPEESSNEEQKEQLDEKPSEETPQEDNKENSQQTSEEPEKEEKAEEKEEKPQEERHEEEKKPEEKEKKQRKPIKQAIKELYFDKYKKLLIIPFTILIIALILISIQIATTGDFIKRDVSLKGGLTITIPTDKEISITSLEDYLNNKFSDEDISVRSLKSAGKQIGITIEASNTNSSNIIDALEQELGTLGKDDYSVEFMGSSLGSSFFKEVLKAIYISFLFMGIVVFWYFGHDLKIKILSTALTIIAAALMFFGTPSLIKDIIAYIIGVIIIIIYLKNSIPSFMVIFNVFSDLIVSLAIINLMNMKLSTAGIAAFLMIIGYSVDTNILLSTKLIKRKEGSIPDRIIDAMKTGFTMTVTTVAAVVVALIFTQSDVIAQIMTILLVGLLVDTLYTWIQNVGILRLYLEKQSDSNQISIKNIFKKIFKKNEL